MGLLAWLWKRTAVLRARITLWDSRRDLRAAERELAALVAAREPGDRVLEAQRSLVAAQRRLVAANRYALDVARRMRSGGG